jgi:isopentenyl diphosphate isomerase/L-lactate dehydrogenase-like FMN-dependent dehydrogenase
MSNAGQSKLWLSLREEVDALEQAAREVLDPITFEFISSGPGGGEGVHAYLEAFRRLELVPRPPAYDAVPDLSVRVLDTTLGSPVVVAPTGFIGRVHPDAELAIARAAASRRVAMCCSSYTAKSVESIAAGLADGRWWYQVYWIGNREATAAFVANAENAGCSAIVITVDTGAVPMHPEAMIAGFADQLANDPVQRARHGDPLAPAAAEARTLSAQRAMDDRLDVDAISWLCKLTSLPVLAKGVLSVEGALAMLECGVDGLVVSNHGGHVLADAVPAIDVLPAIRAAIGNDVPVLLDSGIRTGADIVKAVARGADAVMVGRPFLFALAAGGEEAVASILDHLLWDLRATLANLGYAAVAEVDAACIAPAR